MNNEKKVKLLLIGDTGTGKTIFVENLIKGYNNLNFDLNIPTPGASYAGFSIIYNNIVFKIGIWDTSGQEKYRSLLSIFIKDSDIIFIFYNCNNKNSFERAKFLLELAKKRNNIKDCIYALIGNKYDLNLSFNEKNNIIDDEEVLEFAEKNKLIYSHISILEKYSQGVNELFKKVLNEYLKIKNVV